jgi:predicted RNase H-like nuclease (RuvC/YqgF family)
MLGKMVECPSCGFTEHRDDATFCAACGASLAGTMAPSLKGDLSAREVTPVSQGTPIRTRSSTSAGNPPETENAVPSSQPDGVTVDRKEFEGFLTENQTLLDRSQKLTKRIDELQKENRQLRDELQVLSAKVASRESSVTNNWRETDDSVKKVLETIARLNKEADKRLSK